MNAMLKTDDRLLIEAMITKMIDDANYAPIIISICKRDGNYTCNAAHPQEQEPDPNP